MDTRTTLARQTRERIERIRHALRERGVHALLVLSSDPHLSEYLPEHWQARQWACGFSGSMGTLAVTLETAALFADSRYWVQAEAELAGSGVALEKIPNGLAPAHIDWLARHVPAGASVCVDGRVIGLASAQALRKALDAAGVRLRTDLDLLADVWDDRPTLPTAAVQEHAAPEATETRSARLAAVRAAMTRLGATHHFISTLDDLAWLLNLRGADVAYNPVFLAHALLGADDLTLYIADGKIDAALAARLASDGIHIAGYDEAAAALRDLPQGARLLIDPKRVTLAFREQAAVPVIGAINPSTLLKSRKSEADAVHIRATMVEDGVAMCRFYAWLEAALADAGRREPITEITIDERLSAERARQPGFRGLSFATIAAFNANGAMPHYRALPESHAVIDSDGLLLIDSGGQYVGGTTDITRVWPIGRIDARHRRDYTLVLKGTIALSRTRFPRGTLSPMLDAIARAPLWAEGLDYGHGTGHGVGYFLNVHEGPQSISKAVPDPNMAMEPGMITSIEPGLYRPGLWGIRIENLVLNVAAPGAEGDAFGEFLAFETLTLCPIDTRCIDRSLMRADEIAWLDAYHAEVRTRLAPRLDGAALQWLIERTAPLASA
jgi:Xaa-Pro aminopeptidase